MKPHKNKRNEENMKIAYAEKVISPEIGIKLAGYDLNDVSVEKLDELYLSALALDDGTKKVVIISYDLLGIDEEWIKKIRAETAQVFGGAESDCILSCTHTHTGPNTRSLAVMPEILETEYLQKLKKWTVETVREIFSGPFTDTTVYFYSGQCDENRNRRFIGPENRCSFLPHRRDMERIADGVCDKEIGGLCFMNKQTGLPEYVIGNYAAHPLAGHSPGLGGLRISADFPGAFRKYIKAETGASCMFLSGAAGDMVPHGDETGSEAIRKVGVRLASDAIAGMIVATRNSSSFRLENETLQSCIETREYAVRATKVDKMPPAYKGKKTVQLDIQLLSIGDICLIGVPGELLTELGLEMKWHSPFRKTFILYCSTAYFCYLCHGNALVSGGYEGGAQWLDSHGGLKLVNTAVEGAYKLYQRTYPDPEQWAENRNLPLVSLKNV